MVIGAASLDCIPSLFFFFFFIFVESFERELRRKEERNKTEEKQCLVR